MQTLCEILIKITIIYSIVLAVNSGSASTTSPCEDFYQYACSNYSLENPDPNYDEIIGKMDFQLNKKILRYLQVALKFHSYHQSPQTYYEKMLIYFESCTAEEELNLGNYMDEIRPLWEERKPGEQFDYWPLLGQIQSYGLNNLIVNQAITRHKDDTVSVVLTPADLHKDKDFLEDTTKATDFLKLLAIKNIELNIQQLNATAYKWQLMLQNCTDPKNVKKVKIQHLAFLYPRLNLQAYLRNLLNEDFTKISLITLENSQYFEILNRKRWSAEELKNLGSYLLMKFLYYLTEDCTYDFAPLECVRELRNKFDLAVNYLYYQNFFKRRSKKLFLPVFNILEKVISYMTKSFEQNNLELSSKQILELTRKLQAIKINIGNLPDKCNFEVLQSFYHNLPDLERYNYYKNHLMLLKHRFRNSFSYRQNQTYFVVSDNNSGSTSTPYYVPTQNMVVIPFGCFQSPLFHPSQSRLQQLSLFGFVSAHELTHAFDTISLNYDHQGFPLSIPSDILNHNSFSNSLKCMQQLGTTDYIHERIADVFGVHVAYHTYLEFYAAARQEDWRKEFFVNLAQFFCGKRHAQSTYSHDSDPVRLRQIVKNFPQFAETFECPKGSPMNAKPKCRIY